MAAKGLIALKHHLYTVSPWTLDILIVGTILLMFVKILLDPGDLAPFLLVPTVQL